MTETQADANQRDGDAPDHNRGEHIDDLAEAYALGALDDDERRDVDRHLATCIECRARFDDLCRVTALLAFTGPLTALPSPAVKTSLLARVQQSQPARQPAMAKPSERRTPARAHPFWPRWGYAAVPAALAVLLVTSLAWSWSLSQKLDAAEHQRDTYFSQLTWLYGGQPNARIYAFQPMRQNSSAGGRLCLNNSASSAMVVAWSLDPGQQHILWAVHPDGTRTELMPLTVSPGGNVVQLVPFKTVLSDDMSLMIATSGPDSSMELMLKPTRSAATPNASAAFLPGFNASDLSINVASAR